jgi:hypothetical protein
MTTYNDNHNQFGYVIADAIENDIEFQEENEEITKRVKKALDDALMIIGTDELTLLEVACYHEWRTLNDEAYTACVEDKDIVKSQLLIEKMIQYQRLENRFHAELLHRQYGNE